LRVKNPFRRGLGAAVLICLAGCARQPVKPQTQRIAILRFENLGDDASANWIGRALPVILEAEMAGASHTAIIGTAQLHALDRALGARPASAPGVSAERSQALAAGANRIGYGDYWERGGRLYARLSLEDPGTQRMVKVSEVSTAAGDALGAAAGLAREISTHFAPYATRSEACIRAYAEGLESNDIRQAAAHMEEAIAADPDFGPAYRSLAELDVQQRKPDEAMALLDRGLARGGIAPLERARMQLDAAALKNDPAAKQRALAAIVKLEPENAGTWQSLADTAMARHDYAVAWDAYRHASEIEPENVALLNELGYAATYAGHFDEGVAALRKYRALSPKDANALDSMGDLNLLTNRFREAGDLYAQAYRLDPNFKLNCDLFKGAVTSAMRGDLTGADELYNQYITARTVGHDTGAAFKHAEWLRLTGRRKQASAELLAYARTAEAHQDRGMAARAYSEIAIWDLMDGDRAAGQEVAQQAASLADPSSGTAVAIARFLAQPSASAEEWAARAGRFVPNPAQSEIRDQMLAWALLLDGKYQAAQAPLQKIYDVTGTASNEGIAVLLAWCDVEAGNIDSAAPLLALMPVPAYTGVTTFMPLWFPRLFELRAAVAEKAGNAGEANKDRELFRKLSGR
jgi:tetratricopeptide (TPR) repeat protein